MVSTAFRWGRLVFPGLGKESVTIRRKSLLLLQKYTQALHASDDMRKLVIKAVGAVSTHRSKTFKRLWPY